MEPASTLSLRAADGYPLAATHFPAAGDQYIVVAGATGVPRGFYRRFAEFAQTRGIHVITTDYRGIGDSRAGLKNGSLKGFEMEYADWSRQDLAAAVEFAAARGKVWLVGHSLGGHAVGQLPAPNLLQAAYLCGVGAGWHGWMPRPERYRVWAMWNLIGPIATRVYGYHPMSRFGLGEDLPMGVYRDWNRWCAHPHYFFDDPEAQAITERFANVRVPLAATVSTDDLWAPPASRDAFFKGYRNAPVEAINLRPEDFGVRQIGHMGYFRPQTGATLWPQMLEWLGRHGLAPRQPA